MHEVEPDEAAAYKDRIAGLYDRAAVPYGEIAPPFFRHTGRRLVELAGPAPGQRVLDVGCGRGAVLFPAAERVGATGAVLGVDVSGEMVRLTAAEAAARGLGQVTVRRMDGEALALPDAAVDTLLCAFALFFFPRPDRALAEFRRVLRPGGAVGVAHGGAAGDPRWAWEGDLARRFETVRRLRLPAPMLARSFHQPGDLTRWLAAAGFERVREHREWVEVEYPSADGWWASRWAHGTRAPLEAMAPDELAAYEAEARAHLRAMAQAGPLRQRFQLLFALGARPAR
jgi:O-methyltransferase/aklanonic acid methyltransferase